MISDEQKVLDVMSDWDFMWNRYSTLSEETGFPVKELRKIMRSLKRKNLVRYDFTINTNTYKINGMGYFLTNA